MTGLGAASLLIVESALVAVFACTMLVEFYNRFLPGLRESHFKKAMALLVLPTGVAAGVAHGLAGWFDIPRLSVVALGGLAVVLWNVKVVLEQKRLNSNLRRRPVEMKEGGISWSELHPLLRPVIALFAVVNQVDKLEWVQRRVPIAGLHPDLQGHRIVFLTDFHVHRWMRRAWFREVLERVLRRDPDTILLGGDFISKTPFCEIAAETLKPLARHPEVLAVRGNHDFWTRPSFFTEFLKRIGARLLINEVAVIQRGEGRIAIVGLEHPYIPLTERRKGKLLEQLDALGDVPRIGLIHTPETFPEVEKLGCILSLAGHTHGGQVRLPFFGTTVASCSVRSQQRWGEGRMGRMITIVSNGVGAFYPLRIFCPAQVVEIILEAE